MFTVSQTLYGLTKATTTFREIVFLQTKVMLKFDRLLSSEQFKSVFKLVPQVFLNNTKSSFNVKPPLNTLVTILSPSNVHNRLSFNVNSFHIGSSTRKKADEVEAHDIKKSVMYYKEFERWEKKDKKSFLETVRVYSENVRNRAGHVDFIKAALKHMKTYGVHRDLESYKKLINVLPKGVYICTNKLMVDGMYYPRQQFVALELLQQMGNNGVIPDVELGLILKNIFGYQAHPYQQYMRMFYWTMKCKNRSPFILPRPLPTDPLLLAKLAIDRITSVDIQTEISVFQTNKVEDSIDKTWIVSGQSPKQIKLLRKHPRDVPVIVEGGDMVHLWDQSISYFVLKADGEPLPYIPPGDNDDISNLKSKFFNPNYVPEKVEERTVHQQDDGIIYAVCATGTSSRDSLLSWVRILEKTANPSLADIPVLFRFKQEEKLPAVSSDELVSEKNKSF